VLYGLRAIVGLHTSQEEESYLSLADEEPGVQVALDLWRRGGRRDRARPPTAWGTASGDSVDRRDGLWRIWSQR
jgi:hypothetical protein